MSKIPFQKPVLTVLQQLALLQQRGMMIPDQNRAEHYLRFIGYYRLSGYWLSFQYRDGSGTHDQFKPDTDFETILDRYVFDRQLRVLVIDAVERIEVAARTAISNTMSEQFGAHWYLHQRYFIAGFNHFAFLQRVQEEAGISPWNIKRQTDFIQHYVQKYDRPPEPPSWMIFELLPFGMVSRIYASLKEPEKKAIAYIFNMPRDRLQSWLHAASHIRNLCAHHSRIWNRDFGVVPSVAKGERHHVLQPKRFYNHAVALQSLLRHVSGETHWADRLKALLACHPKVPLAALGFPENWTLEAIWR